MKIELNFDKLVTPHFRKFWYTEQPIQVLCGGAGSGKSTAIAQKLIYRCLTEPGSKFLACRIYRPQVKASCFALLKDILEKTGIPFEENLSDLNLTIGKSHILCRGIEDSAKIKSTHGISSVWFEEANEFSKEEINTIGLYVGRGSNAYRSVTYMSHNPVSKESYVYTDYHKTPKSSVYIDLSTYKDNPYLPQEYVNKLEALKDIDDNLYNVYALGAWGSQQGVIYDRNIQVQDFDFKAMSFDAIIGGIDFGFSDPSTFKLIGVKDQVFYEIDEVKAVKTQNIDFIGHCTDLLQMYGLQASQVHCWADCARPEYIEEFNDNGWDVEGTDKSVDKTTRILGVKRVNIVVHPNCVYTIDEQDHYTWATRNGKALEKPVDHNDHFMDSRMYAIDGYLQSIGCNVQLQSI